MKEIFEDVRENLYQTKQYVMTGSYGWIDVKGLAINLQRVDGGVRIEVWPIETDGLSNSRPIEVLTVMEPEGAKGPTPRKRVANQVRHIKRSGDWA